METFISQNFFFLTINFLVPLLSRILKKKLNTTLIKILLSFIFILPLNNYGCRTQLRVTNVMNVLKLVTSDWEFEDYIPVPLMVPLTRLKIACIIFGVFHNNPYTAGISVTRP